MYIILGGTGHIGSVVARELLAQGQKVTIISSNPDKAANWVKQGAKVAQADVHDVDSLRKVFQTGKRLFLLNPPASPDQDTDAEESRTAANIVAALDGLQGIEKIVAASTYGAQPGERLGDLSVLYEFEQALTRQPIPVEVIRGAYYMTNWDGLLETAKNEGILPTMLPASLKLPMVAPADIGRYAARLLLGQVEHTGLHYVEGPEHYSAEDVAQEFARALGRPVEVAVTPRDQWLATFKQFGFSDEAADSFARMTAATVDNIELPGRPVRGPTSLREYITKLAGGK